MSYYMHHVPGRMRFKTPFIKGSERKAVEVQLALKHVEGILLVSTNTVTGSLTVTYDPDKIDPETITARLTRAGYFDPAKAVTNDQYVFSAASSILSFVTLFI
jgi:hypothetical protein